MARKQGIGDLGYRMRTRIVRALRSRRMSVRYAAARSLELQAERIRQLSIYAQFLRGTSIDTLVKMQSAWTREQVEDAIRTRGGTA